MFIEPKELRNGTIVAAVLIFSFGMGILMTIFDGEEILISESIYVAVFAYVIFYIYHYFLIIGEKYDFENKWYGIVLFFLTIWMLVPYFIIGFIAMLLDGVMNKKG
jgi:hypothetical protein